MLVDDTNGLRVIAWMNEPCRVHGPYNIIRSTNKNEIQYYLNITAAGGLVGFDVYLCMILLNIRLMIMDL